MKSLLTILLLALPLKAEIVKLGWEANPPAEKITSYKVSYGKAVDAMTSSIVTTTNTVTTPDLAAGVWFFTVQAINQNAVPSGQAPPLAHTTLVAPSVPKSFRVIIDANVTVIPNP